MQETSVVETVRFIPDPKPSFFVTSDPSLRLRIRPFNWDKDRGLGDGKAYLSYASDQCYRDGRIYSRSET